MPAKPDAFPATAILIGASLWGVIWYPMRLLEAEGLSDIWLTLVMYAAALIVSLPWTWKAIRDIARSPIHMLLLMVAAGWTNIAFVEAVLTGNILRVLLLFYLSPLWAVLMGWFVLGERPSRMALASLFLAMLGALAMLWDQRIGLPWPSSAADWYALSSGFAFAVSMVITRKAQELSVEAKVFAVWSGVVVLAIAIIAAAGTAMPATGGGVWLGAVALGALGILSMTALVQYGVTHLPVHRSAVLALVEILAGAVSQQLLTDEPITAREWIGGGFIVIGAWLAARGNSEP